MTYNEPHKYRRWANEEQYKFNPKFAEAIDNAKAAAGSYLLDKVRSDLDEGEKFIVARQKQIILADKSCRIRLEHGQRIQTARFH